MPNTNDRCVTPKDLLDSSEVRKVFDPEELDDIERRVYTLSDRLWQTRQGGGTSNRFRRQAAMSFEQKLQRAMRMVAAPALKPGTTMRSVQHTLAKHFAVWKTFGQLGDDATPSGLIRQYLLRAKRMFQGELEETLAQFGLEEQIRTNWDRMLQIKKKFKIPERDFYDMTTEAVELGYAWWAPSYYKTGPAGIKFLQGKYQQALDRMARLGLDEATQNEIMTMGRKMADTYHDVLHLARNQGIEVGELENLGFFPRNLTQQFEERLKIAKDQELGEADRILNSFDAGNKDGMTKAFQKARNTFNYIVEDDVVLDAMLRAQNPNIYEELGVSGISELIDEGNGKKIADALFNRLSDRQLETLSEHGILSKIPMTSPEMRDWAFERFQLPERHQDQSLRKMMSVDWPSAFSNYRKQLKSAAGQSGFIWGMIRNSVGDDGNPAPWGVTRTDLAKDTGGKFQNFVPLLPQTGEGSRAVIPREMIQGFVDKNVESIDNMPQIFVDPRAADMFRSMADLTTEPTNLAGLGNIIKTFNSAFKAMATASPSFLTTQAIGPVFQMWAAGGNWMNYMSSVSKMLSVTARAAQDLTKDPSLRKPFSSLIREVLDDKKKLYKGVDGELVTEAELYSQARRFNFVNDLTPDIGEDVTKGGPQAFKAREVKNIMRHISAHYGQMGLLRGTGKTLKDAPGILKQALLDPLTNFTATLGTEMENAARFETLKTLTFDRKQGNNFLEKLSQSRAAKFIQTQKIEEFDDLDSAIEHAQNYFFMFDDRGVADENISNFVIPFWSYMSRNPVSQVRGAMKHPVQYGNILHAYNVMHQRSEDRVEEEIGGSLRDITPGFVEEQRPLYWTVDLDTDEDDDTRPLVFYLPTRSIDPIGDAFEMISNFGDGVGWGVDKALQSAGILDKEDVEHRSESAFAKRQREENKFLDTETASFLGRLLNETFGQWKGLVGAGFGQEIGTGRKIEDERTSFLGIPMPGSVRYVLEESFPLLQRINDGNPGKIFGQRGGYVIGDDGKSVELVQSKDSIFGAERTDFDKNQYYDGLADRMIGAQTWLRVDYIDPMYNLSSNISDARRNIRNMESKLRDKREELRTETDPQDIKRKKDELATMMQTLAEMRASVRRVEKWADQNNLQPKNAYKQMRKEQIKPPKLNRNERKKAYKETIKNILERSDEEAKEAINGRQ